ncbi:hypothetical protein EVAR_59247_1 [Eumeta japonica]|uniref:Uncharacterized protein n=1 Tax=Eumeta variegata TaxID=151549 RepID=A0A4C2A3H1_EUMVA|nr:hypothetical protein EVAR_59247_1 [Eumeta japonica]
MKWRSRAGRHLVRWPSARLADDLAELAGHRDPRAPFTRPASRNTSARGHRRRCGQARFLIGRPAPDSAP